MKSQDPEHLFDELLVTQIKTGDQKALELLIKRWQKRITIYAFRLTHNPSVAKDITQEVWIAALKNLDSLKQDQKIGSWLLGITHHKTIDWIRKNNQYNTPSPPDILTHDIDEVETNEKIHKMRAALRTMSDQHREILTLFYLEGLSIREIADLHSLSNGTVKSRLFYARESLKKKLNTNNYE